MIRFSLEAMTQVNYAGYTNSMEILRRLTLENHFEKDLDQAELTISFVPEVIKSQTIEIPRLPSKKSVDVGSFDGVIDAEFILSLTEKQPVEMKLQLKAGEFQVEEVHLLTVLPYDAWSGYEEMPELLAAFSVPNHPVIKNLLVRSGELLKELVGEAAIKGYEAHDPNYVLKQISALYSSVAEAKVNYIAPSKDYLPMGKRVRLADEVLEKGYGDDLDLALLFAGLLEYSGLNPLIILLEDHCTVGVWLKDEVYPETVNYDSSSINKRMARGMNQICVFDPLLVTQTEMDFNQAMMAGSQKLADPSNFILSLDIKRARLVGIKPLPVRVIEAGKFILARPEVNQLEGAVLPKELSVVEDGEGHSQTQISKQKVWERKLLDLSLRNRLINHHPDKTGMSLTVHNLELFLKDLMSGQEFNIMHQPEDWGHILTQRNETGSKILHELAEQEYHSNRIRTNLDDKSLDQLGDKFVKGARSSLEETGANSLYLGIGSLMWSSRQEPDTLRQAPLILIPVDIVDKGYLSGLLLKAREEEGHFNITLTEMLKNEFGISLNGLDPLPVKDGELDVLKVFSQVRSAILQEEKWDVHETVHLGLFSFSRFIMWRDLKDNLEEFSKNKLVGSLMAGELLEPMEPIELTEDFIDDVETNADIIYPMSSDASQSLAVLAATEGKSFVLHGPPGTGKSQTITNIIANALLNDQRVLFVAQKMAALEVVERRLKAIGIGAFCLELHSNKSRKKAVLDQLEQSMKIQRIPKNTSFEKEKEAVRLRKAELNGLVKRLHGVDESGYSIYDLIAEYSKVKDYPKYLDLDSTFKSGYFEEEKAALKNLKGMGSHTGGPYGHPLRGIGLTEYRPLLKDEIAKQADLDLSSLQNSLEDLLTDDTSLSPKTFQESENLALEIAAVLNLYQVAPTMLEGDFFEKQLKIEKHLEQTNRTQGAKDDVLKYYSQEFLNADPERLERDFNLFEGKPGVAKLFRKNPVEKELVLYTKTGVIDKTEILNHLKLLREFQNQQDLLRQSEAQVKDFLAKDELEDVEKLRQVVEKGQKVLSQVQDPNRLKQIAQMMKRDQIADRLLVYQNDLKSQGENLQAFLELTDFHEAELEPYEGNYFQRLAAKLKDLLKNLDGLRDWIMYLQSKSQADAVGLERFTAYYHDGHASDRELLPAFEKSVIRFELMNRLEGEPSLFNITGHSLDEKAKELEKRLNEMETLERKELYYHLAGKIPNLVLEKTTSREIGVLQRALRSGARNLSIRNLFSETDNLLRRIAPCMLMSPMSVAQYLKPEANLFDLVVFDEASQIPTAEAIGALGRGKEAIIVGDPKQLPPTSFFMAQHNESDEPEAFQDLDNILEDALALSMPESYLLWHYRSRHESLISFSNRNFYDGKLFTYPSPDDMVSKVTLRKNTGYYERGGARVNRVEASEVVAEVIRRIEDPILRKKSIGIVTFSVVQQNLIEELLREQIHASEELEMALQAMPEQLFVKNLENVQGDERDVILFSVAYGPDEEGRMTMNFGPLNQEGGWRRLNVAVSRARYEMVVFTNIDLNRFNVSPATARGVHDLKAFLEFANRPIRTLTLEEIREASTSVNLNGLIAERLRERGWTVETSIGSSRFKVDLGLVDPKNPNRFILGIMCGGESFQKAQAAYDREVLQKSILKGLEWEIERVFAMDWLEDEDGVVEHLIRRAEDILLVESKPALNMEWTTEEQEPQNRVEERQKPYQRHSLQSRKLMMNEFLRVTNANQIGEEMNAIIEAEGPISRTLLAKRARDLYKLSKVTKKMEEHLELIMNKVRPQMTLSVDVPVYWPKDQDPALFDHFRRTLSDDKDREMLDIAPEEIISAFREVLTTPQAERQLIRQTADLLGHPQLSIDKEHWLLSILNVAVLNGEIQSDMNGRYLQTTKD